MSENPGLKSKRQKRRAVKEDRTKQLIQLLKREDELIRYYRSLPPVPLETPYQQGWKRSFVLINEVQKSDLAAFYQEILDQINSTIYCADGYFKERVHARARRHKVDIKQQLYEFLSCEWTCKNPLNDKQRSLFVPTMRLSSQGDRWIIHFVFSEPWRFELKVEPNIITHRKPHIPDIESELKWIKNAMERKFLRPAAWRLMDARQRYYTRSFTSANEMQTKEKWIMLMEEFNDQNNYSK